MQQTNNTMETGFGALIAPGLYEIGGNHFNSQKLKTGSDHEKMTEKLHWQLGRDVSVYVGWVPDELLPEKGAVDGPANKFFGQFGRVSRIEFVPKYNAQRKQSGHMAFIHYEAFYIQNSFAENIAEAHPEPYEVEWACINKYGKSKDYKLRCCINMTAIRKVEYNASQLTDMFERLNTRVVNHMQDMQTNIDALQSENADMKATIAELRGYIKDLCQSVESVGLECCNMQNQIKMLSVNELVK